MGQFYGLLCLVLFSAEANSNEMPKLQKTRAVAYTNVISLFFCESSLPLDDNRFKKTLEEVHTYAELKDEHRESLPEAFTVCSTNMITGCKSSSWPMFFNILDNNGVQLLAPYISHGVLDSSLLIGTHHK